MTDEELTLLAEGLTKVGSEASLLARMIDPLRRVMAGLDELRELRLLPDEVDSVKPRAIEHGPMPSVLTTELDVTNTAIPRNSTCRRNLSQTPASSSAAPLPLTVLKNV